MIIADGQAIADRLRDFGLPGAIETINERVGHAGDEHAIYLLVDPTLRPVAGNLQAWPLAVGSAPGWYQINLVRDGKMHMPRDRCSRGCRAGFACWWPATCRTGSRSARSSSTPSPGRPSVRLVLAIAGGLFVRRAVLRRVETINRTASAIVQGDFSRRVPTQGSSDEFDQLARTINTMLEQIERLIEGVRNASNVVAHDLRTPLAELRARLETLLRARPPAEQAYEEIRTAVDRHRPDCRGLQCVAAAGGNRFGRAPRSGFRQVDLASIATELLELYEPLAEEKDIALTADVPEEIAVQGDPDLLAQAIGNLVDNAIKYTPVHGSVSLRIVPDGRDRVSIVVSDNGPGIPDADKARVVERFYRGRRGSGAEGIGLGLSVVDAVARLHGGTLTLSDNRPGLVAALDLPRGAGA